MSSTSSKTNSKTKKVSSSKAKTNGEKVGKVPVTILTGFLGSGKTTLLNHLLRANHGFKFAIIENEFGEVGVDEKILASDGATVGEEGSAGSSEEIIEVMNGCICCTVRADLVTALKRLHGRLVDSTHSEVRPLFDAVLIETTGLADPAPVAQTFF